MCVYIYIYIYMYMCVYIYIYIYIVLPCAPGAFGPVRFPVYPPSESLPLYRSVQALRSTESYDERAFSPGCSCWRFL